MKYAKPLNGYADRLQLRSQSHAGENGKQPEPLDYRCPRCDSPLELIQPDLAHGEALLGVCGTCPAWFLIDGGKRTIFDLGVIDRLSKHSIHAATD